MPGREPGSASAFNVLDFDLAAEQATKAAEDKASKKAEDAKAAAEEEATEAKAAEEALTQKELEDQAADGLCHVGQGRLDGGAALRATPSVE